MKKMLLLSLLVPCLYASGQAKKSFESKIIIVQWDLTQPGGLGSEQILFLGYHKWPNSRKLVGPEWAAGESKYLISVAKEINWVISEEETDGFRLVNQDTELSSNIDFRFGRAILHFDRPSNYLDQEMKALRLELTQRIDARTKRMADSTIAAVNQNVLNYLKAIPDDVITKAYKDNLTKQLEEYAKASFERMKDEVLKELRNNPK